MLRGRLQSPDQLYRHLVLLLAVAMTVSFALSSFVAVASDFAVVVGNNNHDT